jgi:flotillin
MTPVTLVVVGAIALFATIMALVSRYKRCPSDKILVIYGKTGGTSAKCVHGGGAFIWPVIQDFAFLDLKPLSIEANLTNALSRQNIRVDVPCRFTIAISTESDSMNTAAERLLGLSAESIQELAKDILFGQLRLVIATMTIEEINSDRDKFLDNISKNIDSELKKIGLKLINVNVTDIRDESGYIEALGKEAAAKAINEAIISVAEQVKIGETGKALADREKDTQIAETHRDRDVKIANTEKEREVSIADALRERDVKIAITRKDMEVGIAAAKKDESIGKAEAERDTRVKTAEANALAIKGENEAKISIAQSDAFRREKEAEALRIALASEKVQEAKALEEAYLAEQKAETARAERERSTQQASVIVPAEIAKQKAIIEAQAEAESIRENAKGEADAIFAKMEAEAKGLYEILTKQAEGYKEVVNAAGGDPTKAFQLLLIEKLPELVRTQVEAVKNIKIDKITVWDSGNSENGNGSTANFVAGMMKTVPPLNDLFNMAGLNLPSYLKGDKLDGMIDLPDTTKPSETK